MLLIAGGLLDPNLQTLVDAAQSLGVECVDWRLPAGASPPFHWDLSVPDAIPPWGGDTCPQGVFIRHDVFAAIDDPRSAVAQRALGWFTAVQGWIMAHPQVRSFNADMSAVALNKPAALLRARHAGLQIPPTWVSNHTPLMRERLALPAIAKPVAGGGLCQTLDEALEGITSTYSAMPALIQPRLIAPELRVFVVGQDSFAFEVSSPSLDYRALQDAQVRRVPMPSVIGPLRALMQDLRMDFGAADFKTDPSSGELVFLELNTSPMFVRFDQTSEGQLAASMVKHLIGTNAPTLRAPQQ